MLVAPCTPVPDTMPLAPVLVTMKIAGGRVQLQLKACAHVESMPMAPAVSMSQFLATRKDMWECTKEVKDARKRKYAERQAAVQKIIVPDPESRVRRTSKELYNEALQRGFVGSQSEFGKSLRVVYQNAPYVTRGRSNAGMWFTGIKTMI